MRGGPGPLARPHPECHLFDLFYMLGLNMRYLENHSLSQIKCLIEARATCNSSVPFPVLQGWRNQH